MGGGGKSYCDYFDSHCDIINFLWVFLSHDFTENAIEILMMGHLFGSVPNKHDLLHQEKRMWRSGHVCSIYNHLYTLTFTHFTLNQKNRSSCNLDIALGSIAIPVMFQ